VWLLAIKEGPLTGILITLVFIGLPLYPILMLVYLPKGLAQRSWSPEEMLEENKRGLSSRTGRFLTLALAAILFSMAWAVMGIYLLMLPLLLAGAAALYMGLRPEAGATWFTVGKGSPWPSYAAAALLLLVSAWQFHLYWKASVSETNWPQVIGIIRDSRVSRLPSGGKGGLPVYALHVTYSYNISGITYDSRPVEVDMEAIHLDKQSSRETLNSLYPKGGPVNVYYDPRNPADSTLGTDSTGGLLYPAVFMLAAFGMFMRGRARTRAQKRENSVTPPVT
ncbi:MAG TPA: DUF3592 domain-containing protein, partial [Elusimicrobiales bacterium]|nr:DUF3592 domain-containing protein [Elusimicrobiales bacterium]